MIPQAQSHERKKMNNVLVVGSLNMDMVVLVDSIPAVGETVFGKSVEHFNGGKGGNQAVACSKFGATTYMISSVGNDETGKQLINNLKEANVHTQGIFTDDTCPSGVAWIGVDALGNNAITVISGANKKLSKQHIDLQIELFKKANVVLVQLEIPKETAFYAIEKAKENGAFVILNPAPASEIPKDILKKIDVLIPNEKELSMLVPQLKNASWEEKANHLIKQGLKNLVCTLGKNGALWVNKNQNLRFEPLKVDAIDTTGAGDCFNGVFACEISKEKNMEDSIKMAIAASAISVTQKGAQVAMPKRESVMYIINANDPKTSSQDF